MKTFASPSKRKFGARRYPSDRVARLPAAVPALRRAEIRHILHGPRIQTKLTVSQPDDAFELEANRVADQVMRMPDLERGIQALRGGGQPLPASARDFFETRFGYDFGEVRIHADSNSAELARWVNARAFTFGRDVVFGAGGYSPESTEDRKLLAHELTHVVQQEKGRDAQKGSSPQARNVHSLDAAITSSFVQRQTTDSPILVEALKKGKESIAELADPKTLVTRLGQAVEDTRIYSHGKRLSRDDIQKHLLESILKRLGPLDSIREEAIRILLLKVRNPSTINWHDVVTVLAAALAGATYIYLKEDPSIAGISFQGRAKSFDKELQGLSLRAPFGSSGLRGDFQAQLGRSGIEKAKIVLSFENTIGIPTLGLGGVIGGSLELKSTGRGVKTSAVQIKLTTSF